MKFAVFNSKRRDSGERIVFVWALNVDGRQPFGGKRRVRAKYFPRKVVELHERDKSHIILFHIILIFRRLT